MYHVANYTVTCVHLMRCVIILYSAHSLSRAQTNAIVMKHLWDSLSEENTVVWEKFTGGNYHMK